MDNYSDSTDYIYETGSSDAPATFLDQIMSNLGVIITIAVLIALGILAFYIIKKRKRLHQEFNLDKRALKVTLPKQQHDERDRKDPKEIIGFMEPFIASFAHYYETDFKQRFWYGQPTFSFEIAVHHGEVFFYVVAPSPYIEQIERQIHAQYTSAMVEPANDHDIFLEKGGYSSIGTLQLARSYIFPVRTYQNIESDPLNAITSSLSKVRDGKAAIQILLQPTTQHWQINIESALHNIQQGKHFSSSNNNLSGKLSKLAKEVGQSIVTGQKEQEMENEALNTTKANVRLTALQEQQAKLLVEKGSKVGFKTQIRCVARAASTIEAKNQIQIMLSSFAQFNSPESNSFKLASLDKRSILVDYILRAFSPVQPTLILNTTEIASIFHFPNLPLETPNIHWLGARSLPPPTNLPKSGLRLGQSNYRGAHTPIYMNYEDRMRHFYMIGKSGVGKTTIFQNMVLQDIRNGHGVCYMDPNGDAVEWIIKHIPKERAEDVIIFDPSDTTRPLGLNLLEFDPQFPEQKTMVINEMIMIFDKLYDLKATGGPIFEQYMRNAMLLIMDDPESGSTLMEIPRVLADPEFRKLKLSRSNNMIVKDFWINEAEKAGGEAALANIVPYITSKLTQFTSNDIMRPIIGQQKSAINFRQIMDEGKILLVTLPKGLLGEMNAMLLGMIISGKIQIAAFSRQNIPENQRRPYFLYVDEFQNFTSKTFATILSEARKYALSLNITNQYIAQLDEATRDAIIGNVGTLLVWLIGATDAEFLQKTFDPLSVEDMVNIQKYNFYIRLLVDGSTSKPFNAFGDPPDPNENIQVGEAIRQLSRLKYGRDRDLVEAEIKQRSYFKT